MSPRLGGLLLFLLVGLRLDAQLPATSSREVRLAAPRISIAQLRVPGTRLKALRQYLRQSTSAAIRLQAGWLGQDTEISVLELPSPGGSPRYFVNWRDLSDEWSTPGSEGIGLSSSSTRSSYYLTFDAEGVAEKAEPQMDHGVLNDWRGEGVPEALVPEMAQVGIEQVSVLRMTPLRSPMQTSLLIEYDRYPKVGPPAEPWGFWIVRERAGEVPEIRLGPWRVHGGPEAAVSVKWDRARRAWTATGDESGKRVRLWTGAEAVAVEEAWAEDEQRWRAAQAAVETSREPGERSRRPETPARLAEAAARRSAAPLEARRSLASLSDPELLEWMSAGRSFADFLGEEARARWSAWQALDPAEAALACVREHLPPSQRSLSRLVFASEAPLPPEEGDLLYSDAPSGCFAPAGGFRYYLHCAREGSFLAIALYESMPQFVRLSEARERYRFARQPLAWAEARRLLQTAWWLSQVRVHFLRPLLQVAFDGVGGSTNDGFATVSMRLGPETQTIEAMRFDTDFWAEPPVSLSSSGQYDHASFVTLTGLLFRHWYPATDLHRPTRPPTGEEARAERATALALLPMTRRQPFLADLEDTILEAAGDLGWREFAPALQDLQRRLPPLTAREREVAWLERQIAGWVRRRGGPASEAAHLTRERERSGGSTGLPGMEPLEPAPPPRPVRPLTVAEARLAPLDALYRKRDETRARLTPAEVKAGYRRALAETELRRLAIFDDERRLARRAREERSAGGFAIHRLAQLNTPRAAAMLGRLGAETPAPQRLLFECARDRLEPPPAGAVGRKRALAALSNDSADTEELSRALAVLALADRSAPPAAPETRKVVEALLARPNAASGGEHLERLALTAARVLGGSVWESLRQWLPEKEADDWKVREALPALTLLAQREPAKFRLPLVEILRQRLLEPGVETMTVCRAIWQADLRELAPELEKIATGSPRDIEDPPQWNRPRELVTEPRFHRARQILSLWQEDDAGTRARLLVAMGAADAPWLAEWGNGAGEVWKAQLLAAVHGLPTDERARLRAFARWCERQEGVEAGSFRTLGAALPKGVL